MVGADGCAGCSTGSSLIAVTRGRTWAGCQQGLAVRLGEPVGGFGTRADLMSGYAAAGERPAGRGNPTVVGLSAPCAGHCCAGRAARYLADAEPSNELAVIGRRVCGRKTTSCSISDTPRR